MSDINKVSLTGHIGNKPELTYFDTGRVVVNFSLAVDEYAGEKKGEITYWFYCRAWGKRAEFIGEYAGVGSFVMIDGHLCVDSYKKLDGTKVNKVYITVDDIKIIDKKNK